MEQAAKQVTFSETKSGELFVFFGKFSEISEYFKNKISKKLETEVNQDEFNFLQNGELKKVLNSIKSKIETIA